MVTRGGGPPGPSSSVSTDTPVRPACEPLESIPFVDELEVYFEERVGQCFWANASRGDCRSSHCPPLIETSCRFWGSADGEMSEEARRFAHSDACQIGRAAPRV